MNGNWATGTRRIPYSKTQLDFRRFLFPIEPRRCDRDSENRFGFVAVFSRTILSVRCSEKSRFSIPENSGRKNEICSAANSNRFRKLFSSPKLRQDRSAHVGHRKRLRADFSAFRVQSTLSVPSGRGGGTIGAAAIVIRPRAPVFGVEKFGCFFFSPFPLTVPAAYTMYVCARASPRRL